MKLNEIYKVVLKNMREIVYVCDIDMNLLYINPAAEKLFGWSLQEVLGKKCHEVIGNENLMCKDLCSIEKANSEGRYISHHEEKLKTRFGDVKDMRVSILPFYDSGNVIGTVVIMEDITECKRVEKENKSYQFIVESARDAIFFKDLKSCYVIANTKTLEVFGLSKEKVIGKNDYEIMPVKEEAGKNIEDDRIVFKTGKPKEITRHMTGTDGKEYWFQAIKTPQFDNKGNIVGLGGIARDVTEHKLAKDEKAKLEKQFLQARKMKAVGTLAGGIAHDFNNILMGIQGYASLMLSGIDFSHPHYNKLKGIKKQVQSGAKLTKQLLGYARRGRYEVKPISLNKLVKETSDTFGRIRKEITIHRELAEDLFVVEADQGQIEQVLLNLYINAADAMTVCADEAAGRNLILKTMNTTHVNIKGKAYEPVPGNYLLLMVTDMGIGIDKKIQENIFDPFFTTKEMGRGTGLGLASVYGIVKGHNGYIEVESKKEKGTTFSIYLPASEKKVLKVVKTAGQLIKGAGTVLLIDDEDAILEVGKALLKIIGYRVLTARDGKEAVEIYSKNKDNIDIVLLDMVMPNMDGSEAYDRMKEINPGIKVLLSSGYSINSQAAKILERGCDGFIQKPFSVKELSIKIMEILCRK